MHSRIFQISRDPIDSNNYITEDRYYDGFVGSIADYVNSDIDRDEDIKWLKELLANVAKFNDNQSFTITDKEKFFESSYNAWQNMIKYMSELTLRQFANIEPLPITKEQPYDRLSMAHYILESSFDDKYSFYMDDNDEYYGNQTLTEFMRNTKNGETWYIGAVIDYHM